MRTKLLRFRHQIALQDDAHGPLIAVRDLFGGIAEALRNYTETKAVTVAL